MKLGYGQDMSLKHTPAGNLESIAPNFKLIGTDGKYYSLSGCKGEKGTLVMFICNHCPYVKAIIRELTDDCAKLKEDGINSVAIMSNDTKNYPEDSFENMKKFSDRYNFSFPYLIDETQEIAKKYDAVCTPDFFGYNKDLELNYRGRIRELNDLKPVGSGDSELLKSMKLIAKTQQGPKEQYPSMGCSIKWFK